MRAAPSNPAAELAIAMFCGSVAKQIAGMIVVLDGVDALVFTGGIGEHDAAVRAAICRQLGWIGVRLDEDRNRSADNRVEHATSRCRVQVLPSHEDEQIARHARRHCCVFPFAAWALGCDERKSTADPSRQGTASAAEADPDDLSRSLNQASLG